MSDRHRKRNHTAPDPVDGQAVEQIHPNDQVDEPNAVPVPVRDPEDVFVPTGLRVTSDVCGRLLIIGAALAVLIFIIVELQIVVIPVAIGILLAALLSPAVVWLSARRVPRGLATVIVMIGGLAILGGLLTFVVNTFIAGLPALQTQLTASLASIQRIITGPPFHLPADWLQTLPDQISAAISANRDTLTSGALTTAATVTELAAGFGLALFSLIFLLFDGPSIWQYLIKIIPQRNRARVDVAGKRAFAALVGYVRATVMVAIVDAVGIGVGLAIVGVPLVVPLAALVFLGSFIPTVGAVLTGAVAVMIALVANGPIAAVIIMCVVIGVQQLEGHVLQPLLLGRAVSLHPLAVVLAVAAGVVLAGIVGALLAVPLLAVLNTAGHSLFADQEQTPPEVDAVDPRQAHPAPPGSPPDRRPGAVQRLWRSLFTSKPVDEPERSRPADRTTDS